VNANIRQSLPERLYALTVALAERTGTSFLGLVEKTGLSPTQVKTLLALARRSEPLSVGDLAELLGASQPTASRIAAGLVARGLLDSEVSAHDRRARRLSLSGDGRALVDRLIAARVADLRVFTDSLSDDQSERLAAGLAQAERDPVA
jgi:DNA-binding MarR family transcriptional regulator